MAALPDWIPELVKPLLERMRHDPACTGHRRTVFERLLSDIRLEPVYGEFLRRDRSTGKFLYPAVNRKKGKSLDRTQLEAIEEVLRRTVIAAGDRISVAKLGEITVAKDRWGNIALSFRQVASDIELAVECEALGFNAPDDKLLGLQDAAALKRTAKWLDHLTTATRRPGDKLIVKRHRGDPIVRGVQISIGAEIEALFGERHDGTAATLTSVALGTKTSARVSRSALTAKTTKKKRTAR